MSARQEPPDPENEDLRRIVEDVAGVMRAEIDTGENARPIVRVHLDGSQNDGVVLDDVRRAVGQWRASSSDAPAATPLRPRRGGLGKSLGVLLAEAASPTIEPRIPTGAQRAVRSLTEVALIEGEYGVSIRATDSDRTVAVVLGVGDNLDQSVVAAVATLLDIDVPRMLGLDDRTLGGHHVITIALSPTNGHVATGSATVDDDRMFAVGEAAWAALSR